MHYIYIYIYLFIYLYTHTYIYSYVLFLRGTTLSPECARAHTHVQHDRSQYHRERVREREREPADNIHLFATGAKKQGAVKDRPRDAEEGGPLGRASAWLRARALAAALAAALACLRTREFARATTMGFCLCAPTFECVFRLRPPPSCKPNM